MLLSTRFHLIKFTESALLFIQVEFDSPKKLLENPLGHLSQLVDSSADADELRAMAN